MLRDTLKQEIDRLSEDQLRQLAELIALVKHQTQDISKSMPFWQRATPAERAQNFRAWAQQLPKTGLSLPDVACDRASIYE